MTNYKRKKGELYKVRSTSFHLDTDMLCYKNPIPHKLDAFLSLFFCRLLSVIYIVHLLTQQ